VDILFKAMNNAIHGSTNYASAKQAYEKASAEVAAARAKEQEQDLAAAAAAHAAAAANPAAIMARESAYRVMGLGPHERTDDAVKKKYRQLSRMYHPDKNLAKKAWAADKFREVRSAYDIVKPLSGGRLRRMNSRRTKKRRTSVHPQRRNTRYKNEIKKHSRNKKSRKRKSRRKK
jgi:hypothetical protein